MLPPKSKAVTAISEQGSQEMKSPITSKRRKNAKSEDYVEGSQGNVESQAKTAATPTGTISKRPKKRKLEELVDDKLEELNDDVVITSVSVVQKPKCSYRNLLDNTLLVKVKEEKLEENIADKEGDWHSTKRCTDEHNDWFRARNPLKVSMLAILPHLGLLFAVQLVV
jgi:predicted metal-binding protein